MPSYSLRYLHLNHRSRFSVCRDRIDRPTSYVHFVTIQRSPSTADLCVPSSVDNWLTTACARDCPQSVLDNAASILEQGCAGDIANGSAIAVRSPARPSHFFATGPGTRMKGTKGQSCSKKTEGCFPTGWTFHHRRQLHSSKGTHLSPIRLQHLLLPHFVRPSPSPSLLLPFSLTFPSPQPPLISRTIFLILSKRLGRLIPPNRRSNSSTPPRRLRPQINSLQRLHQRHVHQTRPFLRRFFKLCR